MTVVVPHVAFETAPWRTVEEFVAYRTQFDDWRLKGRGQLKTLADWHRWIGYQDGTDASHAGVRRSLKGPVDQARRLLIRACRHRLWGLPGRDYKIAAAQLTASGYPTSEQDFKNAGRAKGVMPEHVIPANAEGVREFAAKVRAIWPQFEWHRLLRGAGANYLR
jgi:hypothetical protein